MAAAEVAAEESAASRSGPREVPRAQATLAPVAAAMDRGAPEVEATGREARAARAKAVAVERMARVATSARATQEAVETVAGRPVKVVLQAAAREEVAWVVAVKAAVAAQTAVVAAATVQAAR
jgi:hypothetical protein